ncbi:hypothetical protein GQ600_17507 [Phytophthora cactorum]|nr:hypothetical protein GQ600_17507 [Phytophthora cactorum]
MTKTDEMIEQIRALLADPAEVDDDGAPPTTSQIHTIETDFYVRLRGVFLVNAGTLGIEVMDDIARSIISRKGNPVESLSGAIFAPGEEQPATSPKSCPRKSAKKSPRRSPRRSVRVAYGSRGSLSGQHYAALLLRARGRHSGAGSGRSREDVPDSGQERRDNLRAGVPLGGLPHLVRPDMYLHVHIAHWRWWNEFRSRMLDWQLNAPLKSLRQQSQCPKGKLMTHLARIRFTSMCRVRSDRRLMWMGGQPGRNSTDAKTYAGPTIDNLYELFRRNRAAYDRKMKNSLKPFRLDDGGYHFDAGAHGRLRRSYVRTANTCLPFLRTTRGSPASWVLSLHVLERYVRRSRTGEKVSPTPSDSEDEKPSRADGTATDGQKEDDEEKSTPTIQRQSASRLPRTQTREGPHSWNSKKEAAQSCSTESERAAPPQKRSSSPKRSPRAPASSGRVVQQALAYSRQSQPGRYPIGQRHPRLSLILPKDASAIRLQRSDLVRLRQKNAPVLLPRRSVRTLLRDVPTRLLPRSVRVPEEAHLFVFLEGDRGLAQEAFTFAFGGQKAYAETPPPVFSGAVSVFP